MQMFFSVFALPSAAFRLILGSCCLFAVACNWNSATANPETPSTATIASGAVASATPATQTKTAFEGERAFAHVKAQVAFGPRPAGSAALEKTREYLVKELKSYGLKVALMEFTPVTPRGKVKMKNIIAELPGETDEIIALASHYDTKPYKEFTFLGANDGGSSTGALVELARVLSLDKTKRKFTYQFVFFDGEESFCPNWSDCLNGKDNTYGSRYLADKLKADKRVNKLKALILLDMIGDKDLVIPREESSSSWLVNAIWETARLNGYAANFPAESSAVEDDHSRLLEAGVPAVDLIDFSYGGPDNPYWHSKEDTLDKLSPQSLQIVGNVLLLSLPKIEALIKNS